MRTRKREGGIARVIYPAIPCKDGRSMKKYTSRVVTKQILNQSTE